MLERQYYKPLFPDPKEQPTEAAIASIKNVNKLEELVEKAKQQLNHPENLTDEQRRKMMQVVELGEEQIPVIKAINCQQTR